MSKIRFFLSFTTITILITIQSCNIYRQIPPDKTLLRSNNIEIQGVEKDLINDFFYSDDLYKTIVQQPNSRLLKVFPLSMHIWAFYNKRKITQFSQFMKTQIGAPPILFDSNTLEKSRVKLQNLYFNNGHFENEVTYNYYHKKKNTYVNYIIKPQAQYKFGLITYDTSKSKLMKKVIKNDYRSNIKTGDAFNMESLLSERVNIANELNNQGYYFFNKEYVYFKLDTFKDTKSVNVTVELLTQTDTSDFIQYYIDSVYVVINKSELDGKRERTGTIQNVVFFQDSGKRYYKEEFLKTMFLHTKDSLCTKIKSQMTLQRLTDLNNFKLINPNFSLSPSAPNRLNALYSLTPFVKQFFSVGVSGYNSSLGLIGSNVNLSYNNKNLTKVADRLTLSISTGLEFNITLDPSTNSQSAISRSDISFIGSYTLDKIMVPFKVNKDNLYLFRTNTNFKYSYEKRINFYDIHNLGVTFGYEWSKKSNIRHSYNPLMLNYIFLPDNSLGQPFLDILRLNPYLRASFSNVLVLGSNYQFFIAPPIRNPKSRLSIRLTSELAGNSPFLINEAIGSTSSNDDFIKFNGVELSQYFKILNEVIYSYKFNKPTSIHSRLKIGYSRAFGNSNFIPYVKQFFIGGPYSLRGFPLRSIGPGEYDVSQQGIKDQTGDVLLEGNLEYRFNIVKMFKGALFSDIGNIWLAQDLSSAYSETSIFKFNEFYKQLYVSAGAGLRFDIDFIAVRFDIGFPVRLPYIAQNSGWVIQDSRPFNGEWRSQNFVFNIAVGYPF